MKDVLRLYHGSPEESFIPTFGLGNDKHDYGRGFYLTEFPELAKERVSPDPYKEKFDRRDQEARERMVALAYDEKRNPLRRTFDNLLEEGA